MVGASCGLTMQGLFDFEQDGRYPLRRIPMIVRFKLDACGIKLPLLAWTLLTREQRESLVALPCGTDAEKLAFRREVAAMLQPHADNPEAIAEFVPVESSPAWADVSVVPEQVRAQLAELVLPVPTPTQWQALTELQRFALMKLTRAGHKNANLLPALREFGLVS